MLDTQTTRGPQAAMSKGSRASGAVRWFFSLPSSGAVISVVVVSTFLAFASPQFLTVENLTYVARSFSFIAIAAIGQFVVILTRGIDISSGSVIGLTGIVTALLSSIGVPAPLAILGGLAAGFLVGLTNGSLIAGLGLVSFMVTLGMLNVVRGLDVALTRGYPISNIDPAIKYLGQGFFLGVPLPVWIMLILALVMWWVMTRTVFGRQVYAIGGNEEAARLSGVKVRRIIAIAFILSAVFSGIAGILLTARLGVADATIGFGYELDIIAAAVIGGTSFFGGIGSVVGVIWGAALLGIVRNGMALLGVDSFWQQVVIGAVIILAVIIDKLRTRSVSR
ncbi:ABC transporter permease [Microbacterium sp. SSM24]|uniref:ABC transporter permease n=1 Tax=Microbacterium sp. SSM24 TaxID=2991714 RepID=UPI002227DEBE|nr:ABC transporter permease [Microbacterium sp. SSM24]MCW3492625.1 ABC transporter permease [Microbacterium sp. SSM24]